MSKIENVLGYMALMLFLCLLTTATILTIKSVRVEILENQVVELENEVAEAYDKGYLDGKNHEIVDLMEDYYDVLIENAVLKEQLKNQPSNEKYIEQILDDLELVMELQQYYYQENITSHTFGDWLQINYPALYERVLNYY